MARVYQHGKSWWIDFFSNGVRKRERVIGIEEPGRTKTQCRKFAEDVLGKRRGQVRDGVYFEKKKEVRMTFRELGQKYIDEYAKHNKKTWKSADLSFLKNLNEVFGDKDINEIRPQHIVSYQAKRKLEVSPSTVNHEVSLMRSVFHWAALWEDEATGEILFSRSNPAVMRKKVGLLKKLPTQDRDKFLTEGQLLKLLAACHGEYEKKDKKGRVRKFKLRADLQDSIIFSLLTGMRAGEQGKIRESAYKEDLSAVELLQTKTDKKRYVPLSPLTTEILVRRKFRFAVKSRAFRAAWEKVRVQAGLADFNWHDLRHSFSTFAEKAGVSKERRARILGHAQSMTDKYTHTEIQELVKEAEKLEAKLSEFLPKHDTGASQKPENDLENQPKTLSQVVT